MSDKSRTVRDSMEETKERHRRYLRAINNPLRRKILRAIEEGYRTLAEITEKTKIDEKTLEWHLQILEYGFCIDRIKEGPKEEFIITQEGNVIEYLDK